MFESLINYIKLHSESPLSDDEIALIKESFFFRSLKKKELFLEEGKVYQYTGFILKGAMRQYSIDAGGTEHIIQLSIENWWAVDRESFLMKTPSVYNIDAWEDTDVLTLTLENLERIHTIPAIKEMFWQMNQSNFIASQKRLNHAISLPALERYEELVKNYPDFVQRFPQHSIASYLGISKETLSRVRNKYVHK
jgi:CRP-like cAMP-binding protein